MQDNDHVKIDLGFYEKEKEEQIVSELSGNLEGSNSYEYDNAGASFLRRRGYGWMLETDDDEEFTKPLLEELDINVTDIFAKSQRALLPVTSYEACPGVLRENPDFWGPLFVVVLYSMVSVFGQFQVVSWIISIWLTGTFLIYFVTRSLGADVQYAQCLAVIGYCLLPLIASCVIMSIIYMGTKSIILRWILGIGGVSWSSYSAGAQLMVEDLKPKKGMVLYPLSLLYVYFFSLYTGV